MDELSRKSSLEEGQYVPEKQGGGVAAKVPSPLLTLLIILVAALLLWALFGKLTIEMASSDEVSPVYAQASGVVTEVAAEEGQTVAEGQVLLRFSSDAQAYEMSELQQRIEKVLAVTLVSENDEATADNRDLIDIKAQYTTLMADLNAAKTALAQKQGALATQKAETARLLAAMESAKTAYYNALGGSAGTAIQLEYQEASTAYSQALSIFEQARLSYEALLEKQGTLEKEYLQMITDFMSTYPASVRVPVEAISYDDLIARAEDPGTGNPLPPGNMVFTSREFLTIKAAWPNVAAAQAAVAEAKISYDLAQATLNSATARLETARVAYVQLGEQQQANSAEAQRLSTEFQLAQSNYQSALSLQTRTEAEIASLQQQINAERECISSQEAALDLQFAAAKETVLSQLESELAMYELNTAPLEVVATRSGVVTGLHAKLGDTVDAGSELASVQQSNTTVYHVSLISGKASFWWIIAIFGVAAASSLLTLVLARRKQKEN